MQYFYRNCPVNCEECEDPRQRNNRNARMPQRPDGRQAGIRPVAPYPGQQQQFPHAAEHYQYAAQHPAYNPFPQPNHFAVNLPRHAVAGNPQQLAPNIHPGSAVPLQYPAQRGSVSPPNDGSLPFHYVYSCGFCDEKLNSRNNKDALIEIYQDHYPVAAMCCKSGNEFVAELKNKYGGNLEQADRSKQFKKKPHCLIKECGIPLEIDGIERHFLYRHGLERRPVATTVSSPAPSSASPYAQSTANLHPSAPQRNDTSFAWSLAPHNMALPPYGYGPSTTYGMPMGGNQQASYQSTAFAFPPGGSSMVSPGSHQSSSATKTAPAQRQPPQAGVPVSSPSNVQSESRINATRTHPQPSPGFSSHPGGVPQPATGLSGSTNATFVPSSAQNAPRPAVSPISNPASPAQVPRNRAFSSTVDFVSSLQDDMDPRDWQAPLSDQDAGSAVTTPGVGEAGVGGSVAARNVLASSPQGSSRVASDGVSMSATKAPASGAPMQNTAPSPVGMAKSSSPSTVAASAALAPVMQNLDILEVPRRYADGLRERSCDEEGRSPEDTTAPLIPVPVAGDPVHDPEVKEEPDVPKAAKSTAETTAETSCSAPTPQPRTIPKLFVRKQMSTKAAPTASKRARLEGLDEDVLRERNTRTEKKKLGKAEENRANLRRWICKCGDVCPSRREFVEHWARHKPSTERLSRSQSALLCPRQFCGYLAESQKDFGRHVARHILMQQCYKEKAKEMQDKMNLERENM